ncbi:hypothetical protein [Klebsiella pneumoniae]|uniref:hypothetical protein n=1 Tax=Klebsiella pneumoniae TaxID=573 RepID=UPI00287BBD70|nr:hypothetical protein [Klebsiella pneumoniae]
MTNWRCYSPWPTCFGYGGKNSLNRLIRCVCGKKIGPDPRNFNQRVSLGRNDLLIRTFPNNLSRCKKTQGSY